MEFGTLVLSVRFSLWSDYRRVDGRYLDLTTLRIGKFIFQRPDNNQIVVEVDGSLLQDAPDKIFPLNHANVQHFKKLIEESYERKKKGVQEKIEELMAENKERQAKVNELQETIAVIEEKNKVEFSENRAKNIRELSKAMRKKQNRIENTNRTIDDKKKEWQKYEKTKQISLQLVDETVKKYL
ncbi:hypothetical protein CVD28_00810 [Bacillus sp. M6-12]|uniref:hypothetical protein n=1 Tax=Bacillus sp. M6-12 TaxID=2054166 RepID=UPI000C761DA9|nr:hypothetical protein [Bacillus sp. M6-12]PLS18974.1 hypothetical protein CVD28_00810 [Bacillus sp. M6-12]